MSARSKVIGPVPYRPLVALLANGLGQAGALAGQILLIRLAFDRLVENGDSFSSAAWLAISLGLASTIGVSAWLRMRERVEAERLGQDFVAALRLRLFDRLRLLSPRALQRRSRGAVMLRFVGDLGALRNWVARGIARGSVAAVMVGGALGALAVLDPVLAGAVLVVLGLGTLAASLQGGQMQPAVQRIRRRRSHLAANVDEKIAAMALVQVCGQTRRERKRLERQGNRLRDAMIDRARVSGRLQGIAHVTAGLVLTSVLLVGGYEVTTGRATFGTVVAAMFIGRMLVAPVRRLGRVYEYWHAARVARDKLAELLTTPTGISRPRGAGRLATGGGRIEFRDVTVRGSLQRFSATADSGEVVAVVGPNGAGKSTLLMLIARLLDPDEGSITIGKQEIGRCRVGSVRQTVGMVSPDFPLLRGTVGKNLSYRWPKAPQAEVRRAMSLAGIDELIEQLPDGLETRLCENGTNLSVGQRQRIALARAILGQPPILLLDEPEANLDPKVTKTLAGLVAGYRGTVVWVTHRSDHLAAADQVWYLENGRLIEAGSTATLLDRSSSLARFLGARGLERNAA